MIRELTIKNFKTFVDSTIKFGRVSIVLGANGAGKSNLFDALNFLRSIGERRSVRDAIEGHAAPGGAITAVAGVRGGGASATHFSENSSAFEFCAAISIGEDEYEYSVQVDTESYRVVQEELKSKNHPGPYVFSTRPETGPLEQKPDSPVVVARFYKASRGPNPKREFSPHDFILTQFTSRRAESRVNEDVATAVREEFASLTPLELRPEVLRQYSTRGRTQLGEHGENFAAVVWDLLEDATNGRIIEETVDGSKRFRVVGDEEAIARLEGITGWLSELTPRPIESLEVIEAPTGEVVFAVKETAHSEPIPAPSLSDGTLRFAALALATVGAHGNRILVIEEVENGVSPARLELLVRMLEQAVEVENDQVQVIASTHSPAVLDYATPETIANSVVIGWDYDKVASRPVNLDSLPSLDEVRTDRTLGELQAEGWIQLAADN